MNKYIFIFAFFIALSLPFSYTFGQSTIAAWDVSGISTVSVGSSSNFGISPYAATASVTVTGLTVGGLTRGSGVTAGGSATVSGVAKGWGGLNWVAANEGAAITANQFVTFTMTPVTLYGVSISSLTLSYRRGASGPTNGALQYSTDGSTFTDITTFSYSVTAATGATLPSVNTSTITALQSFQSTTTITFRIVNWGAASAGSGGDWYVYYVGGSPSNGLQIKGTVTAITPIYYSKSTGNLDLITSWGTNAGGTGYNPPDFTTSGALFHIANGNSGNFSGSTWSVGTNTVALDAATDFTITPTVTVSGNFTVGAGRTLTLQNSSFPNFSGLSPTSTINFSGLSSISVPTLTTYGNIIFNNTSVAIPSGKPNLTFAGNLTLQGTSSIAANNSNGYSLVSSGLANQTINANNNNLSIWNFDVGFTNFKTSGIFTLAANTMININGNLIMSLSGSSPQFVDGGNTLNVGGNIDLTGNQNGYNFTGTIVMNGSAASGSQNIRGANSNSIPCIAALNNLTIATFASGSTECVSVCPSAGSSTITVKGNLTINNLNSPAVNGLNLQGNILAIGGNYIYTLTTDYINSASGGTFLFNGSSVQSYSSNVAPNGNTFPNFTIKNTAGVSMNSPLTVSGTMSLSAGKIATNGNTLYIASTGTVTGGSSTSYVNGTLSRGIPTAGVTSMMYQVGDNTASAVLLNFSSSVNSGAIAVSSYSAIPSTGTEGSSLYMTTAVVNRHWNINSTLGGSVSITPTFSYNSGDYTGTQTSFVLAKYNANWTYYNGATVNTVTGTSPLAAKTSITTTGIPTSSMNGDWVAGTLDCITPVASSTSASPSKICVSGTSTLSVSTNTGYAYQWNSSLTGSSFTPIAGATNATYSPSLSATTYYTCSVTCMPTGNITVSPTATVTVNAMPSATITGTAAICPGGSTILTVTGTPSATVTLSPLSTFSITGTGIGTKTVSPGSATTYTITTVSQGACSVAGTGSASITLRAIPTATITGNASVCYGSIATLLVSGSANAQVTIAPLSTYSLDGTGSGTFTTIPTSTTLYSLSAVTLSGCSLVGTGSASVVVNNVPVSNVYTITTIAGVGTPGYSGDGGTALLAQMDSPTTVYVDAIGNMYVADMWNNVVRKIDTAGIITTIAGNGFRADSSYGGYSGDGGPATNAELSHPSEVTMDASGNLYIADFLNHRIRMVNTSGIISTFAGTGTHGFSGDGGPATTAQLDSPSSVYIDTGGNLLIADAGNNRVRKVNTSGVITTIAGNGTGWWAGDGGPATAAELHVPIDVCEDKFGNIFIADDYNSVIRKINTKGVISTIAGTTNAGYNGDGGRADTSRLSGPAGIRVDTIGNLYINDVYNFRIRKVNTNGIITTIAGNGIRGFAGDGGNATAAKTFSNAGLALDNNGNIYIAEYGNQRVRKITYISPASNITGSTTVVCVTGATSLTDTSAGGVWSTVTGNAFIFPASGLITGVTPGPDTVKYTISNSCGSIVAYYAFSVSAQPTATVTADNNPICLSGITTLSLTPTGGAGAFVSYIWSGAGLATTTISTFGTQTISATPPALGTNIYSVTVNYTGIGCSGVVNTYSVTVNPVPTGTVTASINPICLGALTTLSVSPAGGAGTFVSYIWSGPGLATTTVSAVATQTLVVTPSVAGTDIYSVSVNYSGNGCMGAANTFTINVNPLPTATITGTTSICVGNIATITATGTPSANVVFSDGGNITLNGSGSGIYTVSPAVTTTYTITSVTSGAGCTGVGTGTIVVTVNATPTATVTGTTAICPTNIATLTATGTASATVTFSDGGIITLNGSGTGIYTVSPAITTVYTITSVASIAGCPGTGSGSATVTVNATPSATVTGTTPICPANIATLTATGTASATVTFSDGGNITLNGSGIGLYTVSPAITTIYTITSVSSIAGCPGTGSGSATVTVNVAPTATVTGTTAICPTNIATLTATGTASATVTFSDGGNITLNGSGTGIYTVSPAITTIYTITSVTSIAGCSGTGSGSATVTVNAAPTATVTGTAAICPANIATLTATGTASATVTFSDGGIITLDGTGAGIYTVSPVVTTIYSITSVSSLAGCPGTGSGSATVTVNAAPTATVAGTTSICSGFIATLTATGTASAAVAFSDGGNITLNGSGTGIYTVSPAITTIYTITSVSSIAGCPGIGSGSATVTVNAAPTATITGTTAICPGFIATLTATGTASATVTFSDGGNITLNGSGTGIYTVSPAITTVYTITSVTSGAGCTGIGNGSATVTVNAAPTATVTGTTAICPSNIATLTATGTASATVTFSDGGNITLNGSGAGIYTVSPAITTIYTITSVTSGAGCTGTGSGSATVTVNAAPTATVTGTTAICPGFIATLTANGTANATVVFSDGGNITLNGSGTGIYTVSPAITTIYTITSVTSGAGCTGIGSGSATVTVNATPTATITGTTGICPGSIATLSATGTASATVTFSDGGIVTLSGSGTGIHTVSPVVATTYTITSVVSGAGCTGTGSGSATVTINATPSATISGTFTITAGGVATLTATGTASATVTLSDGGIIILNGSGTGIHTVSPAVTTVYTISLVTSFAGCTGTGTGSATVSVNALPTATITAGTTTICTGGVAILSVSGTPGATVTFSDGGNLTLNGLGNGTYNANPSSLTTYTITTVVLSSITGVGTGTAVVTVNAVPTAVVSASANPICLGSVTTLSITPSGGGGAFISYVWNGPGLATTSILTVTTFTLSVTPPAAGANVYSVTVNYSGNGCLGAANLFTVNVNATPTATLTGTTIICNSGIATLTATGTPSATVTLSSGGIITLNGSGTGILTVSPVSTTTYTITSVSSTSGCPGVGSGSATITVTAAPTATVSGSVTTCSGVVSTLAVNGTANATVTFSDGGNTTLNAGGSGTYTVAPTVTTTYTISSVSTSTGCTATNTGSGSAVITVVAVLTASIQPVTSCFGYSTTVTFHGTPSAIISYSVTGGSLSNGTLNSSTGNYTIGIPALSSTIYVTLVSVSLGTTCSTFINSVTTVTPTSITWQGTTSTNWNTASNWNCVVIPTYTDNAVIPSTTNMPAISSSGHGNVNSLTITTTGTTVTLQTGSSLNVYGNLSSNGTITGAGTLSLVGTATQTVSGYAYVGNTVLNNSNGAVINTTSDTLFINGLLSLTSGTLTTQGNGNLVIVTDSNGTGGQIGTIPSGGGSISGNVQMRQWIRYGYRAYRFWGHPFTVSIPLSQLEQFFDITGAGGSTNGFTTTITNSPSSWWYDNHAANAALSLDPGWIDFKTCNSNPSNPSDTNNFKQYEGIRFLDRGYKGQGLDGTTYTPGTSLIGDYGPINMGNQNIPIKNYGTGKAYNQVSNPYPSPVDIGTVIFNASRSGRILGNLFYIWDPYMSTAGAYVNIAYINTVTTTAIPFYIAPNTSFQVRAVSTASVTAVNLNFTEANKSTTVSAVPGTSVPGDLRCVEVPGFTMLTVYDTTYHPYDMWYMNFNNEATDGEDVKYDGGKPVNPDLNFYSWSADNTKLAADARPYEAGKVIPLGFYTDMAQPYIIKVGTYTAPDGVDIYLHDKFLKTFTKLEQGAEYRFNITNDARTQGDNRFEINVSPDSLMLNYSKENVFVQLLPNPATQDVHIVFISSKLAKTTVRIIDVTGVCVYSSDLGEQQSGNLDVSLSNFASGVYLVEVISGDNKVVHRLIKE